MQKTLKYAGLFLLPIIVVIIVLEIFYRSVKTNYTFKHSQIVQIANSTEVLVFGDSHAMYGVNPKWIDKPTFNIANLSQTIYFDELLFQKHINQLSNLEYIVVPMEYTTMSQSDNTQEDIWRKYFYQAQMDLDVPLINVLDPKKYSLALSQKLKRTEKALKIWKATKTLVNCDENGWGLGYNNSIEKSEINNLARIIARKHDDGSSSISQNLERIKTIIEICKTKNAKVVIVNLPVTEAYFENININEVNKILQESKLLDSQNNHVLNLNLLNDDRFILSDFQDADHLNFKGAKKCSLIINEFINDF
jgi:hypothetical protein